MSTEATIQDNTTTSTNTHVCTDPLIFEGFMVKHLHVPTPMGLVEKPVICFETNDPIIKSLQNITDMEELYESEVQISPNDLYPHIKSIQDKVNAGDYNLIELLVYLNEFFKNKLEQVSNMTKSNKINFDNLNTVFSIGTKFVGYVHNNQMVGSIVHSTRMCETMMGRMFEITGVVNMSIGSEIKQVQKNFYIMEFGGVRSLDDLEVRLMNVEDEEYLRTRGEVFSRFAKGAHYYEYLGNMCIKTNHGYLQFKADGRVMIDSVGFDKCVPSYLSGYKHNSNAVQSLNTENLWMCWPYLFGFSFTTKRWGEIYVDQLKPIKFDDDAFDYLVLDSNIKTMMKALIVNVKHSFKDIIGGKSGGCIFMLHGPPGVGKTLTCEAVAELLHKPLYSVTVGELGTNVDSLEKKLNDILEIANSWDAVILIDEADIFMEARNKSDIERNGMVSIFLRLLERHQGVMFLTTNRNEDLDPAFKSRISIIIGYEPLDWNSRHTVWTNLLKAAGITLPEEDIKLLSNYEINGRQIKNSIRMAQSLSLDSEYNPSGSSVSRECINKVLKFM